MIDDEPEKSQYNYLQEYMSIEAWAWEFTRRDPAYQKAWARHAARSDVEQSGQDIPIITPTETASAAQFGLLAFADPKRNSASVRPFWSPAHNPCILKCAAAPRDKRDTSSGALLSQLPCKRTLVQTSDGKQHLLLSEEKHALQLVFEEQVDLDDDAYFEIRASAPGILAPQMEAMSCLDFLLKSGRFKSSCCRMPARFRLTPDILYALDLAGYGLSQREIALRIFGKQAVKDGWDNISHHVQSRTHRLLKKGHNLIRQGHRVFFNRSRKD